ncbi:MAG: hypothetical protein SPG61_06415 [Arcanobacterium sp.]|nr:hypothetical protein [Arcanobacterium sp.]
MSPIFRNKNRNNEAQADNVGLNENVVFNAQIEPEPNDATHADAVGESTVVGSSSTEFESEQVSSKLDNTKSNSDVKITVTNREQLVSQAYDSWHHSLSDEVITASQEAATTRLSGNIDITEAHPTGAARFYSHIETRLSSLIRETFRYKRAKAQLLRLQEIIIEAEEKHGYAPVSLAAGRVTWTELPEIDLPESEWEQSYEATGELRLDFEQLQGALNQRVDGGIAESVETQLENAEEAAAVETVPEPAVERTVPAIFRRVSIEFLPGGDAKLKLSAQASINPVLLKALRQNGIPQDQLAQLRSLVQGTNGVTAALNYLNSLGTAYLPGYVFTEQNLIGCFDTPAQSLLADLEAMAPYVYSSGILAAVAGDEHRRERTSAPVPPGLAEDRIPEVERGIGDHDVAELDVIEAVASGRSIVIDTPPGSERFSTVASIAADAVASGKSFVFVPSRAASGNALKAELEAVGLGELVLDFSDLESVPHRIRTGLRLAKPEFDGEKVLQDREELQDLRDKLANFVGDLHRSDTDWGFSVHDLLEKLASLTARDNAPKTRIRLDKTALAALRGDGYLEVLQLLERAHEIGLMQTEVATSAWSTSTISDREQGAKALARARTLKETIVPAAIAQSLRSAQETGLIEAQTFRQWAEQVAVFDGISDSLNIFLPRVFEWSVKHLIAANASKEWREERGISLKSSERRAFKKETADLVRPGAVILDMVEALERVEERREIWRRYSKEGGWPTLPDGMPQIRAINSEVTAELKQLQAEVGVETDLLDVPFADLERFLDALIADSAEMDLLPERNKVSQELNNRDFGNFLADLQVRSVAKEDIAGELELAFTSSIFERMLMRSKVLASLGPRDIAALQERWRELDLAQVESLQGPVLLAAVQNMREAARANREDTLRLDNLLGQHGLGVLRDVIATYSRLVQAARPIWIVPPVIVVDYLPPMPWVDLVVLDTTEQTMLASTVSLLLRGRQIAVVGDLRRAQLLQGVSAVSAADATIEDDAEKLSESASGDSSLESGKLAEISESSVPAGASLARNASQKRAILAFAEVLPVLTLPTHREQLHQLALKYLQNVGYEDVYLPLPVRSTHNVPEFTIVDGRGVPALNRDGLVEAPALEVEAVVEAVMDFALSREGESLAVITVSSLHARKIREELQAAREKAPTLERLLNSKQNEPFVVVDISQAGGLRRDHVILSLGYGKTVHGRVLHSFGQLQQLQGLFDLIDSLEVSRGGLNIVSSIGPDELDTSRISALGPKLFAQLLQVGSVEIAANFDEYSDSPLINDLATRIRAKGWEVACNYGTPGSQTIPLVAGHRAFPGKWAVAVLIDDEAYVSQDSLRRRDRYRIESFEADGWEVVQTYSTSLFIDPVGQADLVIEKLAKLMDRTANSDANEVFIGKTWAVEMPNNISESDIEMAPMLKKDNFGAQAADSSGIADTAEFLRGARPAVAIGQELSAYTDDELEVMLRWIAADGVDRSESEFVQELRNALAISREGAQIDAVIGNVVRRLGLSK